MESAENMTPVEAEAEEQYLGMSDDEFANIDTNVLSEPEIVEEEEEEIEEEELDDDSTETDGRADVYDDESDDDSDSDSDVDDVDADSDSGDDASDEESSEEEEIDTDSAEAHRSFVEQVTAPFKANGKTMKIDSAEDAVRLMQMGANYSRKMASMKPHLKVLKTLEKHDITEDKLSFLIDIDKKDPGAIARLLKDSEIDPIDFDAESKEKEYRATNHSVDEREIALDEVIEDIKDSDTYSRTLDVVGNKWDDASKRVVTDNPELLRLINDHVASGVYEVISNQLEQDRMLGRLGGMSDIEAYRNVGDAIEARGGFDHLFKTERQPTPPPAQERSTEPKEEAKSRRDKRRAASPTKSAPGKKSEDFNPLGMSDDQFLEQIDERFI